MVAAAVNTTFCPEQIAVPLAEILIVGVADGLTVMLTLLEVTLVIVAHEELEVNKHFTESPLLRLLEAKDGLLVPTLDPSTCHWYTGLLPPLVITALNVTSVPEQTGLLLALIEIVGADVWLTVMVMMFEVAVDEVTHPAFEVKTQVTWSLLLNVDALYDALLVPTFVPFSFH